jgi:beta-glucanase (GH16 family)
MKTNLFIFRGKSTCNFLKLSRMFVVFLSIVLFSISCIKSNKVDNFYPILDSISTVSPTSPTEYSNLICTWNEEFNENTLDSTRWNYQIGNGCPDLCGWGNSELEIYKKENTIVGKGYLIIEAKNEKDSGYTSSRLNTKGKFNFNYGRIDIRAMLPVSKGIWPAFWMLGANVDTVGWSKCGELDIMEKNGRKNDENVVFGTAHYEKNGNHIKIGEKYALSYGDFSTQFHVFSLVRTSKKISWFIDENLYYDIDISSFESDVFQKSFFLLVNLAVGGNWPGSPDSTTVFPQKLIVDYIRVFEFSCPCFAEIDNVYKCGDSIPNPNELIRYYQDIYVKDSENDWYCFTWDDYNSFKQQKIIDNLLNDLSHSCLFERLISKLNKLNSKDLRNLLNQALATYQPTWSEQNEISTSGQTDAGQLAQIEISKAIVKKIKSNLKIR